MMRFSVVFICLVLVNACGWHLAGTQSNQLKSRNIQISELKVVHTTDNRELHLAIERAMSQFKIIETADAPVTLHLYKVRNEKRPLAYSNTGNPIQFQLDTYVEFGYQSAGGEVIIARRVIAAHRQYDFQASAVIAKREEERELIKQMYQDIAYRILAEAK